jgi:TonB family protein
VNLLLTAISTIEEKTLASVKSRPAMKTLLTGLFIITIYQLHGQSATDSTAAVDPNMVYEIVDVAPEPIGGINAFYQKVAENLRYPLEARQKHITGKVFVQFVVEKDGRILHENVIVVRSAHTSLDEEAIRVLLLTSPWQPGSKNGEPVRARKTFPITFNLGGSSPPRN